MSRNDRLFEVRSNLSGLRPEAQGSTRPCPVGSAATAVPLSWLKAPPGGCRGRRLLGNLEGPRNLKESRDQRIRNNNELDLCVCSWKCVPTWLTLSEHISKHTSLRKFWSLFSTAIVANGYIWKYDLRCAPVCFILFDVPLYLHHSWPAYHPLYRPLCLAAAPLEKVWTSYETQEPALKCSFGDMIRRTRNDSGCIPLHLICLMSLTWVLKTRLIEKKYPSLFLSQIFGNCKTIPNM